MNALDFSLPDQTGKIQTLSAYSGKWRVVYFYPKDNTPTCTKQACHFRDYSDQFTKEGILLFGISPDSVRSHASFVKKFKLNFFLLSDESTATIKAYNAWAPKKLFGREFIGTIRKTVVIHPNGEIIKEYINMDLSTHAQDILNDIKSH